MAWRDDVDGVVRFGDESPVVNPLPRLRKGPSRVVFARLQQGAGHPCNVKHGPLSRHQGSHTCFLLPRSYRWSRHAQCLLQTHPRPLPKKQCHQLIQGCNPQPLIHIPLSRHRASPNASCCQETIQPVLNSLKTLPPPPPPKTTILSAHRGCNARPGPGEPNRAEEGRPRSCVRAGRGGGRRVYGSGVVLRGLATGEARRGAAPVSGGAGNPGGAAGPWS